MEWMLLPLKRYADFSGRSRRMEYWMFQLGQWVLIFALFILISIFSGVAAASGADETGVGIVAVLFMLLIFGVILGLFIPNLAVTVRRLHDQDQSGWLVLLNFVPFGGFVLLVFMFLEGTRGPNQYGEDPKNPGYDPHTFT